MRNLTLISSLHPIGYIGEVILSVIRWRAEFSADLFQFVSRDTGKPDQTKTILSSEKSPPKSHKNGSHSNRDSDSCM